MESPLVLRSGGGTRPSRTKWCIRRRHLLRSHAPHLRRRQSHAIFPVRSGGNCNTFDYLGVPRCWAARSRWTMAAWRSPVFVMNYRLWQREFAAIPNPRHDLHPKRQANNLVGSCPCSSMLSMRNFWLPVTPNYGWLQMAGRLKPGVSVALPEPTSIPLRTVCTSQTQVEFFRRISCDRPQTVLDSLIETFGKHFMHC